MATCSALYRSWYYRSCTTTYPPLRGLCKSATCLYSTCLYSTKRVQKNDAMCPLFCTRRTPSFAPQNKRTIISNSLETYISLLPPIFLCRYSPLFVRLTARLCIVHEGCALYDSLNRLGDRCAALRVATLRCLLLLSLRELSFRPFTP